MKSYLNGLGLYCREGKGMVDLAPPAAPKEGEKEGFFSKLLKKVKENPLSPNAQLAEPSTPIEEFAPPVDSEPLDLEEIRSKLGLEEDQDQGAQESVQSEIEHGSEPSEEMDGGEKTEPQEGIEGIRVMGNSKSSGEVSPWTLDSPEDLLIKEENSSSQGVNLESSFISGEMRGSMEPEVRVTDPREMQIQIDQIEVKEEANTPIQKKKDTSLQKNGMIVNSSPLPQENREQVTIQPATPVVFEASEEEPLRWEDLQGLVSEHLGSVEAEAKKMQEQVEKAGVEPQRVRMDNSFIKEVSPEKHFILKNGERIASLSELVQKLDSMPEEVFKAHVTENKNDFANWIRDVLAQEELAEEIRTKNAKEELLTLLRDEEAKVKNQLDKDRAKLEMDHLELERRRTELEKAKARFEELKIELEGKGKEWEEFKLKLIRDIQSKVSEGVSQALVSEKQKLEQERIRIAGMQNKLEMRLKAAEKERERFEREKETWDVQRKVLESLKERERILADNALLLEEREQRLKERELEVKTMQSTLKEALSSVGTVTKNNPLEVEKPTAKSNSKSKKALKKELEVPGEDELRDLEAQIVKKMRSSKRGREEEVKFDLEKLDVNALEDRKKSFSSREELEERITHCRKLIETGKLENAKEEYNLIKELFSRLSLDPEEKSFMYNAVRELYNDIHLALLA